MAMLTFDDHPVEVPVRKPAAAAELPGAVEPDDEVFQRWLAAQSLPRQWFARFYRALRKLQPMFPPMSCC